MGFEKYFNFYKNNNGTTIRPHKSSAEFTFLSEPKENTDYCLFTAGETEQFYQWKDEPDGPKLYRSLSDSLNHTHAQRDRYCLDMSSSSYESFIKRAYRKIYWKPMLSYLPYVKLHNCWQMGITVSGKNIAVDNDGFLRMRIDVRLKKDGISPHAVEGEPDFKYIIDFPTGTYSYKKLIKEINIPVSTAHIGVFIEGKKYCGECFVEQPILIQNKHNFLPPFDEPTVYGANKFEWVGQYFSKKEHPEFKVSVNGKTIYKGAVFERSHRHSEWEIKIPAKLIKAENTVKYELISNYRDALPYTIYEAGIIEKATASVSIISTSQNATVGGFARILIKTLKPNTKITLNAISSSLSGGGEFLFKEAGLHGLTLKCVAPDNNARFEIKYGKNSTQGIIESILYKQTDSVITGSGDMVYINQNDKDMEEYISWYFSSHIGDLITIRPTYRWSGTQVINTEMWQWVTRLFNELRVKYVVMMDGRELPGKSCNPCEAEVGGDGYLGRQYHERDGLNFYSNGNNAKLQMDMVSIMYSDLEVFAYEEDPIHTSHHPRIYKDNKVLIGCDRNRPHDYRLAREAAINDLANKPNDYIRHTGPSIMFKYFAKAGYKWLGAETMYSSAEIILGFLRGAAKSENMTTFGTHNAVQWSSAPIEADEHYKRMRLTLYTAYMQGATDINTEEGFWHMEECYHYHNRFGNACLGHLKQQQDFYRYITSHSRTGEFKTPYAIIHGRDDGANFFNKNLVWGIIAPQTPADDCWDMLKTVYPESVPGECIYMNDCPTDRAVGYYSSTPYGNPDFIPMESNSEILKDYKALIFMGYNRMEKADAEKLIKAAENGAVILLTRAHCTTTSNMEDLRNGRLSFEENVLSFTNTLPIFITDTYNGKEISICKNSLPADEVLLYTDNGLPLLCSYKIGKGEVLLFNTKDYPISEAYRSEYEAAMLKLIGKVTDSEKVWVYTEDKIEFALYEQADGSRHIYFLAVDWYNPKSHIRCATLRLNNDNYKVTMQFGVMLKCVTNAECNIAAWATSENGEVLSVNENEVTVQGNGTVDFIIVKNKETITEKIDFTNHPINIIKI